MEPTERHEIAARMLAGEAATIVEEAQALADAMRREDATGQGYVDQVDARCALFKIVAAAENVSAIAGVAERLIGGPE